MQTCVRIVLYCILHYIGICRKVSIKSLPINGAKLGVFTNRQKQRKHTHTHSHISPRSVFVRSGFNFSTLSCTFPFCNLANVTVAAAAAASFSETDSYIVMAMVIVMVVVVAVDFLFSDADRIA